jgi:hypothetical protein
MATSVDEPADKKRRVEVKDLVLPDLYDEDGLELHLDSLKRILVSAGIAGMGKEGGDATEESWRIMRRKEEVTGLCLRTLKGEAAATAHQLASLYQYDWAIIDKHLRAELLSPILVRARARRALAQLIWDGGDAAAIEAFLRNVLKLSVQFTKVFNDPSEQRTITKAAMDRLPPTVRERVEFHLRVTNRLEPEDCQISAVISTIRDVAHSLPASDRAARVSNPGPLNPARASGRREWLKQHQANSVIYVRGPPEAVEKIRSGQFGHLAEFKDRNFSGEEFNLFSFPKKGEEAARELVQRIRQMAQEGTSVRPWSVRPDRNF